MKTKRIVIFGIVILALISTSALLTNRYLINIMVKTKQIELKSISDSKHDRILAWYNEKYNYVRNTAQSPFVIEAVELYTVNQANTKNKGDILNRLNLLIESDIFAEINIYTPQGKPLLFTNLKNNILNTNTKSAFYKAFDSKEIQVSQIYRDSISKNIYLDFVAPLFSENGNCVAISVFRIKPILYLFPLIQSWPVPSETSEVVLTKIEGDSVVFINELRHKTNTALKFKLPVTDKNLPSVQTALGNSGFYQGKDYRGEEVIAYMQKIDELNWNMVTKIDKTEVYSEILQINYILFFSALLIVLLTFFVFYAIFNYEQKQTFQSLYLVEKKILESQTRFKTVLYSIGDGVIITDLQGNVKVMNQFAEKLTGWSEAVAQNQSITKIFKIVNEKTRDLVVNPVEQALMEQRIVILANETLLVSKSGAEIPISDSASPIRDSEGSIIGAVLVFQDQTEAHAKNKALQFEKDRWYLTFNSIIDPIALLDKSGQIILFNDAFKRHFGGENEKFDKFKCFHYVHSRTCHIDNCPLLRSAKSHKREQMELVIESHTYLVVADPIFNLQNEFDGIVHIMYDISAFKSTEEELFFAKERAEESNKLKTAFLNNISHEIRTPMNAIMGFSELLLSTHIDNINEYSNIIINSSKRLLLVVDDIINISTIEAGKMKLNKSIFSINVLMVNLSDFYSMKIKEKNIAFINTFIDRTPELFLDTDETKLFQILSNLLSNAYKYTKAGEIEFGYKLSEGKITFYVSDTGIGIDEALKDKIFERFYRIDAPKEKVVEGMGLGLSITKLYCEMLEAKIWFDSVQGKGSTFYVSLPFNMDNKIVEKLPKYELEPNDSILAKNITILVAEDDENNFLLIKKYLDERKVTVIHAIDGIETIKILKANSNISLVLMDIKMPKMDGISATKQIRLFNKDIPIIAQSAYVKKEDIDTALTIGCNDYLTKPISKLSLMSMIEKYL